MKLKYICTLLAGTLLTATLFAQETPLKLNINYNYSFPLSNFKKDAVENSSPRGFTGNLMYNTSSKLAVGLGIGYQDYYEKTGRQTYKYGQSQDISAVVSNSIQQIPVMARVEFTPGGGNTMVLPYVSIAAGANFVNYDQFLGQFVNHASATGFRGQAGLGVKIPFGKNSGWGADIGGTYDYAPLKKWGFKDVSSANVHGGIYFSIK